MFTRKPDAAGGAALNGLTNSLNQLPRPVSASVVAPPSIISPVTPSMGATPVTIMEPDEGIVIVGKGARIEGRIGECRRLDVHGVLEGDAMADVVIIREGGGIKGTLETQRAEVHGVFEGTLLVQDHLEIFRSGHVTGEVSYRTLSIQTGGKLRGSIINRETELVEPQAATTADIIVMKQPSGPAVFDGGPDADLALKS